MIQILLNLLGTVFCFSLAKIYLSGSQKIDSFGIKMGTSQRRTIQGIWNWCMASSWHVWCSWKIARKVIRRILRVSGNKVQRTTTVNRWRPKLDSNGLLVLWISNLTMINTPHALLYYCLHTIGLNLCQVCVIYANNIISQVHIKVYLRNYTVSIIAVFMNTMITKYKECA